MSKLFYSVVERRDLGDLLLGDGLQRVRQSTSEELDSVVSGALPSDNAVLAIWPNDPLEGLSLPTALICRDQVLSDFVAWLTTYIARLRPITAFMRIVGRSEFLGQLRALRQPTLGRARWGLTGLIIGEVLASSRVSERNLEQLPLNAYESTLSFALVRASAVYREFVQFDQIVESWDSVRKITRQHSRSIEANNILRVCSIALTSTGLSDGSQLMRPEDRRIVNLCREVVLGSAGPEVVFELIDAPKLRGSREDRVVAFSEFVQRLPQTISREDQELFAFAIGYLASQIAPGTIQHASILEPFSSRFPTALLWYSFCAGLARRESAGTQTLARLGVDLPPISKWIARGLLREDTLLNTPACDIAALELQALSRTGADPLAGLIRAAQSTVSIELAPAVWTVVNVSPKSEPTATNRGVRTDRERDLITVLGDQLYRLNAAFSDLIASEPDDQRQRSLFPSKRKRS